MFCMQRDKGSSEWEFFSYHPHELLDVTKEYRYFWISLAE